MWQKAVPKYIFELFMANKFACTLVLIDEVCNLLSIKKDVPFCTDLVRKGTFLGIIDFLVHTFFRLFCVS